MKLGGMLGVASDGRNGVDMIIFDCINIWNTQRIFLNFKNRKEEIATNQFYYAYCSEIKTKQGHSKTENL